MKIKIKKLALLVCVLAAAGCAGSRKGGPAPLEDPYLEIARTLSSAAERIPGRKAAVLPFQYTNGAESEDGAVVSERLLTRLMREGKIELVERALLEKVMRELNLQLSGVVDEGSIRQLGRVLGVEAVVTGTLTRFNDGRLEVNARLIRTDTASIIAAAAANVEVDWGGARSYARTPSRAASRPGIASPAPAAPPARPWRTPAFPAPRKGLAGYWRFDAGKGDSVEDLSGRGNTARLHGPSWVKGAGSSSLLSFDGVNDYFIVDDAAVLRMTGAVTVAAWINFRGIVFSESGIGVFSKGINYSFMVGGPENWNSNLAVYLDGVTSGWQRGNTALSPGRWYHIAVAYDGRAISFYINGRLDRSIPASGAMRPSDAPASSGWGGWNPATVPGYKAPLSGYLDEILVYDRALSPAELSSLYKAYSPGNEVLNP